MNLRLFVFTLFLFSTPFIYSQYKVIGMLKAQKNNPSKTPPGTIFINDSLYIDKTPVTNIMYLEFLNSLENFWSLEKHDLIKKLPKYGINDTILQKKWPIRDVNLYINMSINEGYVLNKTLKIRNYLFHPTYTHFPVLQITKEQAEMFCKWRTDMVMLLWAAYSKTKDERSLFPKKIKYRIPTKQECQYAITFFKQVNKFEASKKTKRPPYKFNIKNHKADDKFFIYNISEYTLNGVPIGENWKNKSSKNGPNDYTGFRCICEIER